MPCSNHCKIGSQAVGFEYTAVIGLLDNINLLNFRGAFSAVCGISLMILLDSYRRSSFLAGQYVCAYLCEKDLA